MENKITLREFWGNKELLGIHCDTLEKANMLSKAFDNMGIKWRNDKSYLENNNWIDYKKDTVYYNDGSYTHLTFSEENNHIVYEFEDVDLSDNIENSITSIYSNKDKKIVVAKFNDNSEVKVKCREEDDFDLTIGVALAICYKMFGSKNQFKKMIEQLNQSQEKRTNINKKITLKEFFDSKRKLGISCRTRKEAITLLKEFNKLNKKWSDGKSYLSIFRRISFYGVEEEMIYCNDGTCFPKKFVRLRDFKLINFTDIIFEASDIISEDNND